MQESFGVLVVVAMLILRLGVPVGITLALAYVLRRLDARWHPEMYN